MESVAAERLNKIGKNPSIVSNRAELEEDINTVNELIMQTTPLASSGSEGSLTNIEEEKGKFSDDMDDEIRKPTLTKSVSDCVVSRHRTSPTQPDKESLV